MTLISGITNINRANGWTVDLCSDCGALAWTEVGEQRRVAHIYFIPIGRGRSVRHFRTCLHCEAVRARSDAQFHPDPDAARRLPMPEGPPDGLSEVDRAEIHAAAAAVIGVTNPRLGYFLGLGRRLEDDARRCRQALGAKPEPRATPATGEVLIAASRPKRFAWPGRRRPRGPKPESEDGTGGVGALRSATAANRPPTLDPAQPETTTEPRRRGRRRKRRGASALEDRPPHVVLAESVRWFRRAVDHLGEPLMEDHDWPPPAVGSSEDLPTRAGQAEAALEALSVVYLAEGGEDWVLPPLEHWPHLSTGERFDLLADLDLARQRCRRAFAAAELVGRLSGRYQPWQSSLLTVFFALPVVALFVHELAIGFRPWSIPLLAGAVLLLIFISRSMERLEMRRWFVHRLFPAAVEAGISPEDTVAVLQQAAAQAKWCDPQRRHLLRSAPRGADALDLIGRSPARTAPPEGGSGSRGEHGRGESPFEPTGGPQTPGTRAGRAGRSQRSVRNGARARSTGGPRDLAHGPRGVDDILLHNPFASYDAFTLLRFMRIPPPQ